LLDDLMRQRAGRFEIALLAFIQAARKDTGMDRNTTVYTSQFRHACEERALVLTAIGIPASVVFQDGNCALVVEIDHAAQASDELARYDAENSGWRRPRHEPLPTRASGWPGVLVYIGALLAFAICQNSALLGLDWLGAGRIDGARMRDGEWWRAVTALTLHVDTAHLLGNLGFGAAFGYFAGQLLGSRLAWSSILLAGTLGNLLNVWAQAPSHRAVGASTAVFAALGLLSAYAWVHRRGSGDRWAYRWAPLVAGAILLTWFGTGDADTDIVAHLTGFASGALFGVLYGTALQRVVGNPAVARIAGAVGIALPILAWTAALTIAGS
jgi:membrane associated rhomboid family serine protease